MTGASVGPLTRTLIDLTRPMVTPRNVTGEPAVSPDRESVNTTMTCSLGENQLVPPNTSMATTPISSAPSMNPPTSTGFAGIMRDVSAFAPAGDGPGFMNACTTGTGTRRAARAARRGQSRFASPRRGTRRHRRSPNRLAIRG